MFGVTKKNKTYLKMSTLHKNVFRFWKVVKAEQENRLWLPDILLNLAKYTESHSISLIQV